MTTATAAENVRTAGRLLAGWLCAAGAVAFLEARLAITAWMLAWTALGVVLLLDPGEVYLIRRRHPGQLRRRRHR
jgi:hypothetical protein